LLSRQPENAPALVRRGQIWQRLDHLRQAVADYRRAVELNSADEWARLCLGEVLLHLHRPDEAVEHFEFLAQRLQGNPAVQLGLARCRRGQGREEEAAKLLERLSVVFPEEGPIWSDRGQLALEGGQLVLAEECLRRAARLRPNDFSTSYALFQCLERLDRKEEAKAWKGRCEQIDADRKRLREISEELIHKPSAVPLRCEAGRLSLRLGQNDDARGWLESALRQDPTCAAAHRSLADYYEQVGNPTAANRQRQLAARAERSHQEDASGRPGTGESAKQ
jgi:tetratricopeptide (TPR) repeat protein